jgi:hypothetical protein
MMRATGTVIAAIVVLGAAATPAHAAPKSEIAKWLCANLQAPFDPRAAFKTFPRDRLAEPVETRVLKNDDVEVTLAAKGDDYQVAYNYRFKQDDVNDRRLFSFQVSHTRAFADSGLQVQAWLREFGTPRKASSSFGLEVSAGPKLAAGPAFTLNAWDTTGTLTAYWFYADEIQYAQLLCK